MEISEDKILKYFCQATAILTATHSTTEHQEIESTTPDLHRRTANSLNDGWVIMDILQNSYDSPSLRELAVR